MSRTYVATYAVEHELRTLGIRETPTKLEVVQEFPFKGNILYALDDHARKLVKTYGSRGDVVVRVALKELRFDGKHILAPVGNPFQQRCLVPKPLEELVSDKGVR